MDGPILIKALARIVVGVERARFALRRLFPRRITVVRHLAILRDTLDDVKERHAAELAELRSALDSSEAERLANDEAFRSLTVKWESLRDDNKWLLANIALCRDENDGLRAVIADVETLLRSKTPLHQKDPS